MSSAWELTPTQREGIASLKADPAIAVSVARKRFSRGKGFRTAVIVVAGVGFVFAAMIVALLIGSVDLKATTVVRIVIHRICGDACITPDWTRTQELIIAQTRLPRVVMAAVCGAGLSICGMVIQAIVRNPLAGPSILGVSSGAATGAVVVLRMAWGGALATTFLSVGAFIGAMAAMAVVFMVSRKHGSVDPARLILGGVAVSSVLQAITSLLVITSPDQSLAGQVLRWTLGGFGGSTWKNTPVPTILVLAVFVGLLPLARLLNLAIMGDDEAISLGLNIDLFRKVMVVVCALVVSVIVSVAGVISFVGLMLPHVARLLVGSDHRRSLPVAAILGAGFMVVTDLIARRIAIPVELPVGIITSIIGGPVFVYLIQRRLGSAS